MSAMVPRRVRVPDEIWFAAMQKARDEGTTLAAKIRGWLIAYLAGRL